jgi:hypothetical protein
MTLGESMVVVVVVVTLMYGFQIPRLDGDWRAVCE